MNRIHFPAKALAALMILSMAASSGWASPQNPQAQPTQPTAQTPPGASNESSLSPQELDALLAPVALYPDQLLAQIFLCTVSPYQVGKLDEWLAMNQNLKGSAVQEAAEAEGFDPSFVAMSLFPQVVNMMAQKPEWTQQLGEAFGRDRKGVFDSVQRLRDQAKDAGNLATTAQQEVRTQTTESGQQVIVIEPANPQVIYVPQYNPQVVYTQPPPAPAAAAAPSTTTVIVEDDDDDEIAAGLIGFTAGVVVGAVSTNSYYWGPYGWYGGGYMYAEAWDDYYDFREDAREDWMDHREDMAEERGDRQGERTERQGTRQDTRTERQGTRQEDRTTRQGTRQESQTQRQSTRQGDRTQRQTARQDAGGVQQRAASDSRAATRQQPGTTRQQPGTTRQQPGTIRQPGTTSSGRSRSSYESRGYSGYGGSSSSSRSVNRSGTRSDAFSGYSSSRGTRSASSRGRSSRSYGGGRRGGGRRR